MVTVIPLVISEVRWYVVMLSLLLLARLINRQDVVFWREILEVLATDSVGRWSGREEATSTRIM